MENHKIALCLRRPGHEIKVLGWAAKYQPVVTIFTDGSGSNRSSRLESTRKVPERIGCRTFSIFGEIPDREIYEMMKQGHAPFITLAEQLLHEWADLGIHTIAGDAIEGNNTTHDVCRMIINAVMEKMRHLNSSGIAIRNLAFPWEGLALRQCNDGSEVLDLNDQCFEWKRCIVKSDYPELVSEVDRMIVKYGEAPFRREVLLRTPEGKSGTFWESKDLPYYEVYGRKQVEEGDTITS